MEKYLKENFVLDHAKRPSEEALRRWRSAVSVVRNPRRRFRMVADLAKRAEAEKKRQNIQKITSRIHALTIKSRSQIRQQSAMKKNPVNPSPAFMSMSDIWKETMKSTIEGKD